jgi:hypothetical protein
MRFATSRAVRPRLRELVAALHEDRAPAAATWRLVGETAAHLGILRPSYPHVRRLVADEERRRRARSQLRDVLRETASTFAAGRVPNYDYTTARWLEAQVALDAAEACVSETQAFLGDGEVGA